ncbi:AAA family ATPase [uncultured Paracoccus sp.]|uniref:AAA family ATPase n=1 Tax=uncultured Paracoccus sp. TaxID=189685 RepID=UPI00260E1EB7|nr:AAA family ATPase [uncultured Paracoccus sp.]
MMISGCSGGGKSSLLSELARRGYATVTEPGRRVVEAELSGDGANLPWVDLAGFGREALRLAVADHRAVQHARGPVFFDRGIVDATLALQSVGQGAEATRLARQLRYDARVFLTPPWPAIHVRDHARRHGFRAAVDEYRRLRQGYPRLGYRVALLPRIGIRARADWLLARL